MPAPPTRIPTALEELAGRHHGVFNVALARHVGVPPATLRTWARRGVVRRVSHGVYCLRSTRQPLRGLAWLRAQTLWPAADWVAVTGDAALWLRDLARARVPDEVGAAPWPAVLVTPAAFRTHRRPPDGVEFSRLPSPAREQLSVVLDVFLTPTLERVLQDVAVDAARVWGTRRRTAGMAQNRVHGALYWARVHSDFHLVNPDRVWEAYLRAGGR